jgi:hypothetical protein
MRARIAPALALCTALGGCGACEPDPAPSAGEAASAGASAPDARATGPWPLGTGGHLATLPLGTDPALRSGVRPAFPCRAIAVEGEVRPDTDAGPALAPEAEIAPERWFTLAPNARLVAKDPRTTRETTFRGPGRVRACVDWLEESWVASGKFESTSGAGETPGAEEWVVTPLGVVRFGAAKLTVEAPLRRHAEWSALDAVRVAVTEGVAFVWIAVDASRRGPGGVLATGRPDEAIDEGWARIGEAVVKLTSSAPQSALRAAGSAVDSCVAIGTSARDLARALLTSDGAAGATAARQVTTRRLARAACAVAALRVAELPSLDAKASLSASLNAAQDLWRTLPTAH